MWMGERCVYGYERGLGYTWDLGVQLSTDSSDSIRLQAAMHTYTVPVPVPGYGYGYGLQLRRAGTCPRAI